MNEDKVVRTHAASPGNNVWKSKPHLRADLGKNVCNNRLIGNQYFQSHRQSPFVSQQRNIQTQKNTRNVFVKKQLPKPPKHNIPRRGHIPNCKPNLKHDCNKFKWIAPNLKQHKLEFARVDDKDAFKKEQKNGELLVKELLNFDNLLQPVNKDLFSELGGCFNANDGINRTSEESNAENIFSMKHVNTNNTEIRKTDAQHYREGRKSPELKGKVVDVIMNATLDDSSKAKHTQEESRNEHKNCDIINDESDLVKLGNETQSAVPHFVMHEDWDEELEKESKLLNDSLTSPNNVLKKVKETVNEVIIANKAENNLCASVLDSNTQEDEKDKNKSHSKTTYADEKFDNSDCEYDLRSCSENEESWSGESMKTSGDNTNERNSLNSYEESLSGGKESPIPVVYNRRRRANSVSSNESEFSEKKVCGSVTECPQHIVAASQSHSSDLNTQNIKQVEKVESKLRKPVSPCKRSPRFGCRHWKTTKLYNWKTNQVETISRRNVGQAYVCKDTVRNACTNRPGVKAPSKIKQQISYLPEVYPSKTKTTKKNNNVIKPVDFPPLMSLLTNYIPPLLPPTTMTKETVIQRTKTLQQKSPTKSKMTCKTVKNKPLPIAKTVTKLLSGPHVKQVVQSDPYKMTMEDVLTKMQASNDMTEEVDRVDEKIRENIIQLKLIAEEKSPTPCNHLKNKSEVIVQSRDDFNTTTAKKLNKMDRVRMSPSGSTDSNAKATVAVANDSTREKQSIKNKAKIAHWESRAQVDQVELIEDLNYNLKRCDGHEDLTLLLKAQELSTHSLKIQKEGTPDHVNEKEEEEKEVEEERSLSDAYLTQITEDNISNLLYESFHEDSFIREENHKAKLWKQLDNKDKYDMDASRDIMMMETLTIEGAPKEVSERIDQSFGVFKSHWSPYEKDESFWNNFVYQVKADQEILILNEKPLPESLSKVKNCSKDCYFDDGKKLHLCSPETLKTTMLA